MEETRVLAPAATREDDLAEASIRPKRLDDYLGQQPVREQLKIAIEAAKGRGEAMDHVLIFGPPGLGKTTLSHVIANELGVNLRSTSGPVIERAGDLAALLTNLQPHDTTFFASRESLTARPGEGMALWRDKLFLFMSRNATPATEFFHVPGQRLVELGTQVEI